MADPSYSLAKGASGRSFEEPSIKGKPTSIQEKRVITFTDTGKSYGPFGSLPLAQKHARAKRIEDKAMEAVELRPSVSPVKGGYVPRHRLSSCWER